MTVPTGLFVDSPEMNDVSLTRLSNESEMWPEEIVQKIKERIPKAASLNMMVKFMKQDDESGTATGSVIINSTEKTAIVPVVIKDFMMNPMDVMIADNKILPLTPDYFESVFLNNNLFQKLEEYPMYAGMGRFDNYAVQLNEVIYPPNMGRYSYANGGFPILEAIASTINPTEFKDYLRSNPSVAVNFEKKGNADILKQITKIQPVNVGDYAAAARDLIPRNILMVKKMGYDNYSILANSDQVFDPRICKNVKRRDLGVFLQKIDGAPHDILNDVDRNGEKILYPEKDSGNAPYLFEPQTDQVIDCKEYGFYQCKKMNGVIVNGWVVPRVINFDSEVQPLKLFIGSTMSTMQPEFAGVQNKEPVKGIHCEVPKAGMTGSFVFESDNKAIGTVPVTVLSVAQHEHSDYMDIRVQDLNGRKFNLRFYLSKHPLQTICKREEENRYIMPFGFKFCPMEGFHELTSSAADYHVKTAGAHKSVNPATLIHTGYGYYSVKGIDKYASASQYDKTNIPEHGVKFLLTSLGCGTEQVDATIKTARVRGKAVVHNLSRTPLLSEKIASSRPLAERMAKVANLLKSNLTKEASFMENNQTVDTLLSLNFVSPENLTKFINFLPQFKAAISSLCSCLLASRLGVQEIPESAASSAMYRLIDVVNGLEKLRAIQEHGDK